MTWRTTPAFFPYAFRALPEHCGQACLFLLGKMDGKRNGALYGTESFHAAHSRQVEDSGRKHELRLTT